MKRLAIIGGTGLTSLEGLEVLHKEMVVSPYGEPSGPLTFGSLCGQEVVFVARHGYGHTIPPHKVNYRANIWVMKHVGVSDVIAVAAVGGISEGLEPGTLVIPDQIIDYTWSRGHTFFEDDLAQVTHIDFTRPYCDGLRRHICEASLSSKLHVIQGGTYGASQGPRLETAAEIDRMEQDGCAVVGMTGMPEASLARELGLCYASINVVANRAAGRGDDEITMEQIKQNLDSAMANVRQLLQLTIPKLFELTTGQES